MYATRQALITGRKQWRDFVGMDSGRQVGRGKAGVSFPRPAPDPGLPEEPLSTSRRRGQEKHPIKQKERSL
jgi:hypothetical protein